MKPGRSQLSGESVYKFEVKDEKTLIPKLIFSYVLFVVLGFIILCTFTQHAITHYAETGGTAAIPGICTDCIGLC